jgi:hypothetical protein
MADIPVLGFRKYWTQKLASLKSESDGTTNKHTEAAALVQQVYKVLSDTDPFPMHTGYSAGMLSGPLL